MGSNILNPPALYHLNPPTRQHGNLGERANSKQERGRPVRRITCEEHVLKPPVCTVYKESSGPGPLLLELDVWVERQVLEACHRLL